MRKYETSTVIVRPAAYSDVGRRVLRIARKNRRDERGFIREGTVCYVKKIGSNNKYLYQIKGVNVSKYTDSSDFVFLDLVSREEL